jgi:hypothetical protein
VAAACIHSRRSDLRRGRIDCVSGSPSRQLNSMTFGVELDDLRSVRGEGKAYVEEAAVGDAASLHLGEDGERDARTDVLHEAVGEVAHGAVGPHAAGVGPDVALKSPLVVPCGLEGDGIGAVAEEEDAQFGSGKELLDDHGRFLAAGERASEASVNPRLGLGEDPGDEDALAGSEAVGLHHVGRGVGGEVVFGGPGVGEPTMGAGGDAGSLHHLLGE